MASVVTQWGDSVNVPDTALDLNLVTVLRRRREEPHGRAQEGICDL